MIMCSYLQVSSVDLIDDLQVTRQECFQHRDRPSFQSLREEGVVSVSKHFGADTPCLSYKTYSTLQLSSIPTPTGVHGHY